MYKAPRTIIEILEEADQRAAERRKQYCQYGNEHLTTAPFPNGLADCHCGRENLRLHRSRLPRHYQGARRFFRA